MRTLFEEHLPLVGKVMNMQLERQNVIMGNVANVRTPGYRPLEIEFEKELQEALQIGGGKLTRTDKNHVPAAFNAKTFTPEIDHAFKPRRIHGEDRVNLDKEMAKMAKVNLQYSTLTTIMTKGFEGINNIITEGGK